MVNQMFINKLSIRNYKNFSSANLDFVKDSVNTIIGENASGKTNLFNAMRLILDDSLPLNSRILESCDFYRGLDNPFGHWIVITLYFDGLGDTDEEQILVNYTLNKENDKSNKKGNYTFIFRPKNHIRKLLHDISRNHEGIEERKSQYESLVSSNLINKESYEAVAFVRSNIDFTLDEVYRKYIGDFQSLDFPSPDIESAKEFGNRKPPFFALGSEVACTYVKALRNVVSDLKYYKTNPLYKLLTLKSKEIDDNGSIVENVKEINKKISTIPEIERLSNKIAQSLINTVGNTYSPKIQVSSQLPEDFTELIQSLGLIVEDSSDYNGSGKIEDLSLGGANLIYLALKLYEYEEIRDSAEHVTHFLLIEEPEAHIHNHIQKTLFDSFNFNNTQVFVSTHSTQISSVSKISSMNILARQKGYTDVFQPAKGLSPKQIYSTERYLDAIRSDILFAKSVILVEGDAELILIPVMIKEALGVSLDELGISLIKVDGTVFKHISNLFHNKRLKRNCAILTDLDAAYVTNADSIFSQEFVDSLKSAERDGERRRLDLEAYALDNEFVEVFYANNTFETEFLAYKENNVFFKEAIESEYERKASINLVKQELSSDDPRIRSRRVLAFANKIGKGWLATKLASALTIEVRIPDYILRAVKFAIEERDSKTIIDKMFIFNLNCMGKEECDEILAQESFTERMVVYKRHFDDSFVRFLEL